MQSVYPYTPETNRVSRQYSVASILLFLFMVHITIFPVLNVLYFYISTLRSTCAVPNMAVFCSYLISCFPGTLLRCFLNDFEIFPVAPIIIGITYLLYATCFFLYHISVFRNSNIYYISIHIPFSFSRIMMYVLLLRMVLSVCTC